ncbi:HigA family addiction module antitoxin [Falsihalocynthiibacter sp. CO-5D18]|uniref:HigA family addiction module antitoxin n=1 Tax=Falsihalocynthiibacter sp. CO-5D18 TaxID=3240872 RepID=UPI00351026EB
MMTERMTEFRPDYAPRLPGEYLRRFLNERGIKIVDFARRTGRPTKAISEIISGKVSITPETAIQFERVLGEGAGFWLALEAKHQLSLARSKEELAGSSKMALDWAKRFPMVEMLKLGLLDKKPDPFELVDHILKAFGVSSIPAWEQHWQERLDLSRFKQQNHNGIDPLGVAVWLRGAEIAADRIETAPYSEAAFRSILPQLKTLSKEPWQTISDELVKLCATVGVAVALIPSVPRTGLRGAAYWATKNKAVIVLSDRLGYEANVWFAFFHECCHILDHSKKSVFIDKDNNGTAGRDIEADADRFSAETIIAGSVVAEFKETFGSNVPKFSSKALTQFANQHDVDPGLLLVRLQREDVISYKTQLAKIKRRIKFNSSS